MEKKKIKHLHIIQNEKFTQPFIDFINENFNKDEHLFLVIDGIDEEKIKIKKSDNIIRYKTKYNNNFFINKIQNRIDIKLFKFLNNYCNISEKIYFHNFFDNRKIYFLYFFRKFLKKSNWITWGGDIHCYENRKNSILYKILYKIEDYVKTNVSNVNVLVPEDYDVAKKYYNIKGKYHLTQYPIKIDLNFLDSLILEKKEEIYIQIGNSADSSNNHKDILNNLLKFKDEKIKIYAVLSYGDKSYAKEVINYGKKLFEEKFIPITDFMEYNEYWKYLKDIDVLIFNHKRQQGLGNIFMLSYLEKKIYLRDDISSWNYLSKDIGLELNSYENIKNQNFEEFKKNNADGNRKILMNTIYSTSYVVNLWENIFKDK